LEVMLGTRFGRKSPGKVSGQGIRVSKRGGRMSAEQLSSIIDQDSLDMESSNSNDQTGMEPLVRFLPSGKVCFTLSLFLPKKANWKLVLNFNLFKTVNILRLLLLAMNSMWYSGRPLMWSILSRRLLITISEW
jgi:hypothetical protein